MGLNMCLRATPEAVGIRVPVFLGVGDFGLVVSCSTVLSVVAGSSGARDSGSNCDGAQRPEQGCWTPKGDGGNRTWHQEEKRIIEAVNRNEAK
jgi:hypothetical protein